MDLQDLFKYELCSYPVALFETTFVPRQADKPVLADGFWKEVKLEEMSQPSQPLYVLDGEALLLHRIPWKHVKDATHSRRGSNNTVALHCDLLSTLTVKKDVFLRDKQNKQRFINMLSEKLKEVRFDIIPGAGDADILIAQPAVSVSATRDSVVIADDTDILNLLCDHGNNSNKKLFFKPKPKRGVHARQDVIKAGERALVELYGGKVSNSLEACYILASDVVCSEISFPSHVLPGATLNWESRASTVCLGIGKKKTDSTLTPEMTDITPALETLLRVIRCNCKVDCNIAQSAVTESTDLTVHLLLEGVVEVLVLIHTSSDRSR
ncbi:hypothetical protein ACROYT_G015072 [Oculina patagonica]